MPLPLLLNVVQSVELKYPSVDVVACVIDMLGVAPPDDANGLDAVTADTPPVLAIVIAPAPLVMVMLAPAVSVALDRVLPVELPISN